MVDVLQDAEPATDMNVSAAQRASDLIAEMRRLQTLAERLESELKLVKDKFRQVSERDLPTVLLDELGMRKLPLADGSVVEVRDFLSASPSKERLQEAFAYLRDRGAGPLIKTEVAVRFSKEEAARIEKLLEFCALELGQDVKPTEKVHPQSLAAWCREQLAAGVDLDFELLGIFAGRKAVLK